MTVAEILDDVCCSHRLTKEAVLGRCRVTEIVSARHEFFFRALAEAKKTSGWVENRYGFNRVTVLHGAARHAQEFGLENPSGFDLAGKQERSRSYHRNRQARAA